MGRKLTMVACAMMMFASLAGAQDRVVKIGALANGGLLLNGKPSDLAVIDSALGQAGTAGGEVWYYRENPAAEPHPNAMAAVQLVIKHRLPVSFSSKPDFSDTVDPKTGISRPRKPGP